ncbi:MAG: glutamyl-tRNA reductase [Dehalococcoidia bacterium]
MHVSVVGVNYSTTPIRFLEKLTISTPRLQDSLLLLRHQVSHGIILSTCNRTEVYAAGDDDHSAEEASIDFLKASGNVSDAELLPHIYRYKDETVFGHLVRVASGLDSMIIGEFEVLGQVGRALKAAEKARMVNLPLRILFQHAIRTGRRVREETGISKSALSVSSVAVDLATRIVGDLSSCQILVIGAGEAGALVAKAARERGASQIIVYNRSRQRASALAEMLGTTMVASSNLMQELSTADIAISCTAAPHIVLKLHQVEKAMSIRPDRPLAIIDIAVPRDVDPRVKQINNVFLCNIDNLTEIAATSRKQREDEIQRAMEIIKDEVDKFTTRWQALAVRPVVSALMKKAEDIRRAQLDKTLNKLQGLSDEERDSLEAMTKAIVTKMLNDPIQYLKKNAQNKDYSQMVSELFHLNTERSG